MSAPAVHAVTRCEQCGTWDDHPKVHFGPRTTHHDCLRPDDKIAILGGAHVQHPLLTATIIKAAEDGERGDDLRDLITGLQMRDFGDAQMLKAASYANDVLDQGFQNGTSGTYVIGATTYTLPDKCRFQSTLSTATTQGTEFPATGGYTAGGVSLAGLFTTAATAQAKASTGAVTVTNSPAGTWAGNEITDSSGTPKRKNFGPPASLAKTVSSGDTCSIPIGSLTGAEL